MAKTHKAAVPAAAGINKYYYLIAAVSILLYANTLGHGYALDDVAVVEQNKFVRQGIGGIPEILSTFYWQGYWDLNAGLYRPLSLLSFALEYQLSPDSPFIHHFFNVVYYAVTCCLLFEFLKKVFHQIDPRFFLFAVLLFCVHPIHTEVVANIKSRDEILALLFFLLCCRQLYAEKQGKLNLVLAVLFFFLSLLSKEGAVIFLPVIFLIDYMHEKRISAILRKRWPLILVTCIWLLIHQYVIAKSERVGYTYSDNSLLATSDVLTQKATALGIFARYILKAFLPYSLSYDYSFSQIPLIGFFSPLAIAGLLLLILCGYAAVRFLKNDPLITFSLALIVLPLLLTSHLIFNIGATMADRFLFIPTIGSSLLICYGVYQLSKTDPQKKLLPMSIQVTLLLFITVFSLRTFSRNKDWKDNEHLFTADVTTVPNSARAHYNYAVALMNSSTMAVDPGKVQREFEKCLSIDSLYIDALVNLAVVHARQKDYTTSLRINRRALQINKNNATALGNIGDVFFKQGQMDSTVIYLKRAHLAGNTLTGTYNVLGTALFTQKRYDESIAVFKEGIRRDTTNGMMYLNYGNALAVSNKFPEALDAFQRSYRIDPANAQPLYYIALTYQNMGDTLNASLYYNEFQKLRK